MASGAPDPGSSGGAGRLARRLAFSLFAGSALVFLILEHRAHLLGAWPLLFLFFCVGAHFLMHRGHSGGGGHGT
jgi:hypothetical protein